MLRLSKSYIPLRQTINCIYLDGGVGDHICALVPTKYMLEAFPWVTFLIWVPDYFLEFAKNLLPEGAIVRSFTDMKTKYDKNRLTITTRWDGLTSAMKMHLVDYASIKLCDRILPLKEKNYLRPKFEKIDTSPFQLPEKYICIATGYTAKVREFSPSAVNEVTVFCKSMGYEPVFLGQKETKTGMRHVIQGNFSSEVDYNVGIDLRDKTSLLQASKIMQGAKALVGVDCGLMHVAGCTDVPIVGGFTTVRPELRAPIRKNILGLDFYPVVPGGILECRFCQSETGFLKDHDYRYCPYKDYKCVEDLTGDKFIRELSKIIPHATIEACTSSKTGN